MDYGNLSCGWTWDENAIPGHSSVTFSTAGLPWDPGGDAQQLMESLASASPASALSQTHRPYLWTHCAVGPYDIVELKVTSLHLLETGREAVRVLGVAAGESLHNIYRVIMTSLGQREVRPSRKAPDLRPTVVLCNLPLYSF